MRVTLKTPYAVGDLVNVYAASQEPLARDNKAPRGAAVTSANVAADSTVTFAGLAPDTEFFAAAQIGGAWHWIGFRSDPSKAAEYSVDDPEDIPYRIDAPAGQTADLFQAYVGGVEKLNIDAAGVLHLTGVSAPGPLVLAENLPPIVVDGGAGDANADTAALQAALASLPTLGGRKTGAIWLRPNTRYKLNAALNCDDTSGITIECIGGGVSADAGRPMLEWVGGAGSGPMISARSSYGLHLKQLVLVYSNVAYDGDLVKFGWSASNVDCFYSGFERCWFGGAFGAVGARSLVNLDRAIVGNIRDCQFINALAGVRGVDGSYAIAWDIAHNVFNRCLVASIYNVGEGWHIHGGNAFEQRADGSPAGIINDPLVSIALGVVIDGNWFGDVSGGAAGAWIDLRGRGIVIEGNRLHIEADAAAGNHTAIILRNALGASIKANNFSSAGNSRSVDFQQHAGALCDAVSLEQNRLTAILPPTNEANVTSGEYRNNVGLVDKRFGAAPRPVAMPSFTVATRPAAATYPNQLIFVSDAAAGSKLQYSDGAAWVAAG